MSFRLLASSAVVLFLLLAVVAQADGQLDVPDNTIYGHVFDAKTGRPIPSALMYCSSCSSNMTTIVGYYQFSRCFSPFTAYTIDCIREGYKKYTRTVTTDLKGKAEADFYLQPKGTSTFIDET